MYVLFKMVICFAGNLWRNITELIVKYRVTFLPLIHESGKWCQNSIEWNFFWLLVRKYMPLLSLGKLVLICLLKGTWWSRSCASFPAVNKTADWWCLTCQEVLFALHLRYVQTVLPQVGLSLSVIFYYWAWVIDRNRGFGLWNFGQPVF